MATSVPVHVEVLLKSESVADYDDVRTNVVRALSTAEELFSVGECSLLSFPALGEHVQRIVIAEIGAIGAGEKTPVAKENAELFVHVFKLNNEPPVDETADDDASVVTCQQLELPASALDGLWESLIYDSEVKDTLLAYATTAMLFAEAKVNPHIISWNRVVLLHGPPGTGKTSLCKALAQKLSIRLANRYPNAYLLEINAHSLFSKWFSESGKLVMKLFRQILDLVEDGEALVCVLIDEVESLTAARQAAASGSDPSDAIRVVNALLTQLDALKQHPNVLVLTTSNITGAIDLAFVDRADIKQYIGPPSSRARYEILRSCVEELQRVGIVQASGTDTFFPAALPTMAGEVNAVSRALLEVAEAAVGLSGRALRKLPFQAYALRAQAFSTAPLEFIALLAQAVHQEKQNIQDLASG